MTALKLDGINFSTFTMLYLDEKGRFIDVGDPDRDEARPVEADDLGLLVVLVLEVQLRPDATHQQSVVLPKVLLGDVDEFVAEVLEFRPVFVVIRNVADLYLIDECVLTLVPNR